MAFLPTLLNIIGSILLTHAVYSAYEHSTTQPGTSTSTASSSASLGTASLPLDITIETLFSILLLCTGIVLRSPALKPISWSTWAGQVEQDERKGTVDWKQGGGNPFRFLEERPGFTDIRAKRKEFADWVREGGNAVVGKGS